MTSSHEPKIILAGGNENVVVQVGDTVRRPLHPWTPAVHALLRRLEANGFAESSRVLGIDEQGREMLTMIAGEVGNYPLTHEMTTDAALVAGATMLRWYHEAATIQPDWRDLPWRYRDPDPAHWEVICHGDVAPYNIVYRHILPNVLAPIIVAVSFAIPGYILAEASLSFLGIGIRPPTASWGSMVFQSFPIVTFRPIFVIMPSVLIALIMIAFAFVGDGLRDALDPQSNR